jgi:hypothetical protein
MTLMVELCVVSTRCVRARKRMLLPYPVAHVVPDDEEDIGRAFWRLGLQVRLPVGLRVADIQVDDALKWFGHGSFSLCF